MKQIVKSPYGHKILEKENNLVIAFKEPMLCYSTSQLNGGIQELTGCFNHKLTQWIDTLEDLPNGSIEHYLQKVCGSLNLDWSSSTGLITTASMENASIEWAQYRDISLFAVITAGAGVNAVRAGDPPSYYEEGPDTFVPIGGTINILLVIEATLPVDALARSAIIVTEAKAAILQELNVQSCFSKEIATGTGTDGLIIACHKKHPLTFSDVGNHSQLGFLISTVVKKGVAKSLLKEKKSYEMSKEGRKQ